MTVEVAGQFGAEKSKEWLVSFCISVVESVFISQPLKVQILFSVYSRRTYTNVTYSTDEYRREIGIQLYNSNVDIMMQVVTSF